MKPSPITPLLLGLLVLPGCPSADSTTDNPGTLYLAPGVLETQIKLIDHEPEPF
jgi:hypothetical protein